MTTYIIREPATSPVRYVTATADAIAVRYRDRLRPTGRTIGGLFTEVTSDGKDTRYLSVAVPSGAGVAHRADGVKAARTWLTLRARTLDLADTIRTLDRDDELSITLVDERIGDLLAEVAAVRAERAELVKRAWRRGGRVTVAELTDRIATPTPAGA